MNIQTKRLKQFHAKYKKSTGCWLWYGTLFEQGYGRFGAERAHRIMWKLLNGSIPDGLYILHKCDVRNCVRPNHLFLGTAKDNMQDCLQKGRFRAVSGNQHGLRKHPEKVARGNRHGSYTHPEKFPGGFSPEARRARWPKPSFC